MRMTRDVCSPDSPVPEPVPLTHSEFIANLLPRLVPGAGRGLAATGRALLRGYGSYGEPLHQTPGPPGFARGSRRGTGPAVERAGPPPARQVPGAAPARWAS